jgi:phospholipid/cholesterol/gamma-HCH transport system substrate-binding protein
MPKNRLEIKVGLFVLIALVLLAVLVVEFSKRASLFHGTYNLQLNAVNIGGLKERADVLLAGYKIGNVGDIQLSEDERHVAIHLKIDNRFKIHSDARFVIEQAGFLGDQYVAVIPTTNSLPFLANNAQINCEEPFNMQEVARSASGLIQHIDDIAKKLDASVSDLRRVVLNEQTLTNLALVINNARDMTEQGLVTLSNINTIFVTNSAAINLGVSNFVSFTTQLNQLGDSAGTLLATNGEQISLAVQNIKSATETLKTVANDVQAGKGLAGTILHNEEMATNVQAIAANLAITTSNLNRGGLWGILWSHKPTSTNAPAKPRNLR